jgi:hypothetical protein
MGKTRNIFRILVGKSLGIYQIQRWRKRWEDNVKIGR